MTDRRTQVDPPDWKPDWTGHAHVHHNLGRPANVKAPSPRHAFLAALKRLDEPG